MSGTGRALQKRTHLDAESNRKLERTPAEWIIEARERAVLPATDWQTFRDALFSPPAPNTALKRAARRYREQRSGHAF